MFELINHLNQIIINIFHERISYLAFGILGIVNLFTKALMARRSNEQSRSLIDEILIASDSFLKPYQLLTRLLEPAIVGFSSKLFAAIEKRLEKRREKKDDKSINLTMVELLLGKKARQNTIAYIMLLGALFIYLGTSYLVPLETDVWFLMLLVLLTIGVYLNQKFLTIRVAKGYYGTNEYEAREIIRFILKQSGENNFHDGSTTRELFPELKRAVKEKDYKAIEEIGGVTA